MKPTAHMSPEAAVRDTAASPRRLGVALMVIAMAQLMVVLDATIVTTALPHIQRALDFSGDGLQWVVTAYAITFGGLLLLGGRAGDRLGRKRIFITGLFLFSAASLAGGLAQDAVMLLAMRAAQGVGAAMISPTALALVTVTFPEGRLRNRAMGVYAAMSGSGGAIGLVTGGLLTTYVSWRWVLFVNVPIGLITAVLASGILPESGRNPGRFDLPGAITGTGGVAALVYGLSNAGTDSSGVSHWRDPRVVIALIAAVAALTAFVVIERRSAYPLLPMRLLTRPSRAGSYLTMLCAGTAVFGVFFFLTLFLQEVKGYSAIGSGLAFLPFSATVVITSEIVSGVVARTGPRSLMLAGGAFMVGGTLWLSRLTEYSGYATGVVGPIVLIAAGMGLTFVPMTLTAVSGVEPAEAGAAASLLSTGQQLGGAIGLAALGSVAWTVAADSARRQLAQATAGPERLSSAAMTQHALASGFERGFLVASGVTVLALVVIALLVRQSGEQARAHIRHLHLPHVSVPVGCPGTHYRLPRLHPRDRVPASAGIRQTAE